MKWNSNHQPLLPRSVICTWDCAVGILCRIMKSFEKAFDPSIRAAFLLGQKHGIPATISPIPPQTKGVFYLCENRFLCRRQWVRPVQATQDWYHSPVQIGPIEYNHELQSQHSLSLEDCPFHRCLASQYISRGRVLYRVRRKVQWQREIELVSMRARVLFRRCRLTAHEEALFRLPFVNWLTRDRTTRILGPRMEKRSKSWRRVNQSHLKDFRCAKIGECRSFLHGGTQLRVSRVQLLTT